MYTGSGGRDLSGNKRTAIQSCDQTLTKTNRALARNCAAPLSDKGRVKSNNWKEGKPVRVVSFKKLSLGAWENHALNNSTLIKLYNSEGKK